MSVHIIIKRVISMNFPVHLKDKKSLSYADFCKFVAKKAAKGKTINNYDGSENYASWKNCAVGEYLKNRRPETKLDDDDDSISKQATTILMKIEMPYDLFVGLQGCAYRNYADLRDAITNSYQETQPWTHDEFMEEIE